MSLSMHTIICTPFMFPNSGVLLLDLEARDLPSVVYRVVEELHIEGLLDCEERKAEVLRVLLYRHKYVEADAKRHKIKKLRRTLSQRSINVSTV